MRHTEVLHTDHAGKGDDCFFMEICMGWYGICAIKRWTCHSVERALVAWWIVSLWISLCTIQLLRTTWVMAISCAWASKYQIPDTRYRITLYQVTRYRPVPRRREETNTVYRASYRPGPYHTMLPICRLWFTGMRRRKPFTVPFIHLNENGHPQLPWISWSEAGQQRAAKLLRVMRLARRQKWVGPPRR